MKTPAYRPFIQSVGKIVHHLNTVAVGLSGVEAGLCKKPEGMDISWTPVDLRASSRDARAFILRSAIVFVAEELSAYTSKILGSPSVKKIDISKNNPSRSEKFEFLCKHLDLLESHLFLGPLTLLHWRNRIVHKHSNASLTSLQQRQLTSLEEVVFSNYKGLSVCKFQKHFNDGQPTLKDVSSLIAMTINLVKQIEASVSEPSSGEDVSDWLKHLSLCQDYERIKRVAIGKKSPNQTITNFFVTYCPELLPAYNLYVADRPRAQ